MLGTHVTISGQPDKLAEQLTQLTCRILKKERSRNRVIVQYVPAHQWFVPGGALVEDGRRSFKLEVTITDETNARSEKASYHKTAYELLA